MLHKHFVALVFCLTFANPNFMVTNQSGSESNFYAVLGERIRIARKGKNLDQSSLAQAVSLTRTSIINIEKGRQRPSIYQLWMMAQILEVPITDLFPSTRCSHSPVMNTSYWEHAVTTHNQISDESQKKIIMDFIALALKVEHF